MDFEQCLKPVFEDSVRFSRSLAGSNEEGDDILQDALVRAWKGFSKLRDKEKFKPWLMKIISNTHRSSLRRKWLRNLVSLDAIMDLEAPQSLPYEEKELVRISLQSLPQVQRAAVIMFEVLNYSILEIASIQGVTPSAVKSRLSRGRKRLKEKYIQLSKPEAYHETGLTELS